MISWPTGLLALLALGAPGDAPLSEPGQSSKAVPPESEPIVVTGERPKDKKRAVLGSRVPQSIEPDPRGFVSQVASDTGIAGLTPGSGMDPFAGGTRKVIVKSCKSSDARITIAALCDLALAQKRILEGNLTSARSAIDRVLINPKSAQADTFFAHRFAFQIAGMENDLEGRREALEGMLGSGLLSAQDRASARKTLASMALARGDKTTAISELERLLTETPNDAKVQGNLGALYANARLHDRARPHIEKAIQLTASLGQVVPRSWTDYLSKHP